MKKSFSLIVLFALSALVLAPQAFADSRDWTLQDIKGNAFKLSENLGDGPVLLVFWATWCIPCKSEIAEQKPLFDSFVEKGVKVVLVSIDTQKTQAKVKPFIESKKYPWPVILDSSSEVLKRYGGTSVPFTVLLDKNGDAKLKIKSAIKDSKDLSGTIEGLLSAKD